MDQQVLTVKRSSYGSDKENSCGGCHPGAAVIGKTAGKTCRVRCRGTFNDGIQFDSSCDRGEPLEFVWGAGMMILGFETVPCSSEKSPNPTDFTRE